MGGRDLSRALASTAASITLWALANLPTRLSNRLASLAGWLMRRVPGRLDGADKGEGMPEGGNQEGRRLGGR